MIDDKVGPLPLRRDSQDPDVEESLATQPEKDESEYMLKWNEHNSQLISVFHQLCQDNQFTDVTLATETETFQAHKLILSACSPYFKKLFTQNPCKHPVVFLKDIPENHMKLLLEYMYRGSISVKHHELQEILSTASSLKIRGLTTAEAPPSDISDTPRPLIVDEHPIRPFSPVNIPSSQTNHMSGSSTEPDKFQHIETGSSNSATSGRSGSTSRKGEGRKSSAPKKLRLSGDRDSDISSPRHPPSLSLQEHIASGDERRPSPDTEHIHRNSFSISPTDHDNIAVSEEEDLEIAEQPVDFSKSSGGPPESGNSPYSILGSYLKTGRSASPEDEQRNIGTYESMRRNSELSGGLNQAWMGPLANFNRGPRPASRDSRGDSREERDIEREGGDSDREGVDPPTMSLKSTLGIDIADRLRSHFLANLPSQSYAWLNGMQGLGGKGSSGLPTDPASPLSNGRLLDSSSDALKMEKHPVGGIRTGEIGANGKPAVACEVCGKKLADPSSLYRHRKIHSGDKPHKCPHCPRRFIQRYNMKQHIKTHRIQQLEDMKEEIMNGEESGLHTSLGESGLHASLGEPGLHASLKNLPRFMQEQGLNMTQ